VKAVTIEKGIKTNFIKLESISLNGFNFTAIKLGTDYIRYVAVNDNVYSVANNVKYLFKGGLGQSRAERPKIVKQYEEPSGYLVLFKDAITSKSNEIIIESGRTGLITEQLAIVPYGAIVTTEHRRIKFEEDAIWLE